MIYRSIVFKPRFHVACGVCGESKIIKLTENVCILPVDSMLKVQRLFEEALEAQAEADGWDGNFCPSCIINNPSACKELSEADDDNGWEGEE